MQSGLLDADWRIDFDEVRNDLAKIGRTLAGEGLDLSVINNQLAAAKIEYRAGAHRLRFATKLRYEDGVMSVDADNVALLRSAVGGRGPGWYVVYASTKRFGLVTGRVTACAGDDASDALVHAAGGSFYAVPAANGTYALPVLASDAADPAGKPSVVAADGPSCAGLAPFAMTDVTVHSNPKCVAPGAPEDCGEETGDRFSDGTSLVTGVDVDLETAGVPKDGAGDACADCGFESGDGGFAALAIGGTETPNGCFATDGTAAASLFPDADGARYAYLTTGGDGLRGCVASRTVTVPDGATSMTIRYDLATQEYSEWVGGPYADVFVAFRTGAFGFAVNRAVGNAATGSDFVAIPEGAAGIAEVGVSADAAANANGPVFDGHLRYSETNAPRGGVAQGGVGRLARFDVTPGETFTLLLGVFDGVDAFWDSAALIEDIRFE
ncbi:MAG: choice-of-anchor L domain-containing protein [Deltaproteobacteria bacterium]|nr:choice-of-anchor L domain-containing protein [Deltaproteobacteria bacterium]